MLVKYYRKYKLLDPKEITSHFGFYLFVYVSLNYFRAHLFLCFQQFINESVLTVNLDILRIPGSDSWTTALSLGSNSKVVVLERTAQDQPFSQIEEINGPETVSDNVSCL